MEQNIQNVANGLGGAVGHGIDTGIDGYNTYHDIIGGNYTQAITDGAQTLVNGIETVKDAESGQWISPQ